MQYFVGVQEAHRVKRACVLDCRDEEVAAKLLLPLTEALDTRWECDAHFFAYHLDPPEEIPGVAKSVLPLIRDKGSDLLMDVAAVDIDTDPHEELTSEGVQALLEILDRIFLEDTGLPQPNFFYTTRGGARLIWKLKESIPVDEMEPYLKGLHSRLIANIPENSGFSVGTECYDWTRVFRLPKVIRDGDATWDSPTFMFVENSDDTTLDIREVIIPVGQISMAGALVSTIPDVPQPTPEEVDSLLAARHGGRVRLTDWSKVARHRLTGRECAPYCFDGEELQPGNRDSGIQRLVGQATGLLAHLTGATAPKIYALFYDSISRLTPDDQTSDWTMVLWRAVLKYWTREQAKQEQAKRVQCREERKAEDKLTRIIRGMQEWCETPALHDSDEDVRRTFAMNHLICADAYQYFIIKPDGYYHPIGTSRPIEVPAMIQRYGMDDLIQLQEMQGKTTQDVPFTRIFKRHGTKVSNKPIAKLETKGYHVHDMDGPEATLLIDLYRRDEWVSDNAEWHPEVDKWLRHLVSAQDYNLLEAWIAYALAFDEGPTAALSLAGPPGIGKQLFIQGLAECINTQEFATAREFGRFREKLLHTPFLVVNEGLPRGQEGVEDVADIFRHFVSGDPLSIEVKNRSPITVYNPLRLVFTANNTDVIIQLAGHRSLTREDQEALLSRLIHIKARSRAARYLTGLGGREYTGRERHWVAGPEGPSEFIVAKHFMWIYQNCKDKYPRGNRFLIEGQQHVEFMDVMRTEIGIAPQVIEALILLIETKYSRTIRGLAIEKGRVYVTNEAVQRKLKESSSIYGYKLPELRKTISGLMANSTVLVERKKNVAGQCLLAHWKELDVDLLHREAIRSGLPHEKLDGIVSQRANPKGMPCL